MNQLRDEGSPDATEDLWALANGQLVNVNIYSERLQHRGIWDIPQRDDGLEPSNEPATDEFQQDETTNAIPNIVVDDSLEVQLTRDDVNPEIIPSNVVLESHSQQDISSFPEEDEDESMGEPSDNEENEFAIESDSDTDPDVEP
ncbi:hypothetical protein RHMOL_Rhmol05G0130300 [Rhododendron molle]|uniref:Uncharacterized protein n=1 Tax=Rhododendron molle TaxID=49168 RepID=A0ACC0NPQ2_RHOML|nr:hypothetical protein RHMOL_Rhmol05G0130300 [Rhododendron molle]